MHDPLLDSVPVVEGHKVVGQVILLQRIGAGGIGVVFRGWHLTFKIDVAIKFLRPSLAIDVDSVARFRREAEAALKISHPHIVRAFDVAEQHGLHYIVMEYFDGESVTARMARWGRMREREAVTIITSVAAGLAEAHRSGLVHRDVKPDNLLISRTGRVKLANFGLEPAASGTDGHRIVDKTSVNTGTPLYVPPEQGVTPDVRATADVWALGATLYYLLTGEHGLPKLPTPQVGRSVQANPFPSLRERLPGLSPHLHEIFERCVQRDPTLRFANADELHKALLTLDLHDEDLLSDDAFRSVGESHELSSTDVLARIETRLSGPAVPLRRGAGAHGTANHGEGRSILVSLMTAVVGLTIVALMWSLDDPASRARGGRSIAVSEAQPDAWIARIDVPFDSYQMTDRAWAEIQLLPPTAGAEPPKLVHVCVGSGDSPAVLPCSFESFGRDGRRFVDLAPGREGELRIQVTGTGMRDSHAVAMVRHDAVETVDLDSARLELVTSVARNAGRCWRSVVMPRLVHRSTGLPACITEPLAVRIRAEGSAKLSRADFLIEAGSSSDAGEPIVFTTADPESAKIHVLSASAAITYEPVTAVTLAPRHVAVQCHVSPRRVSADGVSYADVHIDLIRADHGLDGSVPLERWEEEEPLVVHLTRDLQEVELEASQIELGHGTSTASTRIRSDWGGNVTIGARCVGFTPSYGNHTVAFVFPWHSLTIAMAVAALAALLVSIMHNRARLTYALVAVVAAVILWTCLQQGVLLSPVLRSLRSPFSPTGSMLIGLIGGLLGDVVLILFQKWFGAGIKAAS